MTRHRTESANGPQAGEQGADTHWEEFVAEARKMANDICLVSDSFIARLIGVEQDALDYYWIVQSFRDKPKHHSAVGSCVSLKGIYRRYDHLEWIQAHNGCPPVEHFRVEKASYEDDVRTYGKRVADEEHGKRLSTEERTTGTEDIVR